MVIIGVEGGKAPIVLKVNTSLTRIYLSGNNIVMKGKGNQRGIERNTSLL